MMPVHPIAALVRGDSKHSPRSSFNPTMFDRRRLPVNRRRTLSQRCLRTDRRCRCSDTDVFTEDKVKFVLPGDFKRPLVKTISENRYL
jgi:hypothetical protein